MIDFVKFFQEENIKINGILHVGAHKAEEEPEYEKLNINKSNIVWLEANHELVNELKKDDKRIVFQALISDEENQEKTFIITNNLQSSSILELDEHKKEHPWVHETERRVYTTTTIDSFLHEIINRQINFLVYWIYKELNYKLLKGLNNQWNTLMLFILK